MGNDNVQMRQITCTGIIFRVAFTLKDIFLKTTLRFLGIKKDVEKIKLRE